MFRKSSIATIVATTAILGVSLGNQPSQAQNVSFVCAVASDNIPTTMANTPNGRVDVFKWQSTYFRKPYTPMQRCQEVSQRMNVFKAQGSLDYLTSGRVNNQPVVCAGRSCNSNGSNVLLTLRNDQNPNQVLQEINANRQGAAGPSRQLTGGSSSSSNSDVLEQNSDGTMTLDMNRYLGTSASEATENNSSQSPIFRQNPESSPSSGGASNRW